MAKKVMIHNVSEILGAATSAKIDIDPGDGNLEIARLTGSADLLASGSLEYLEKQGAPVVEVTTFDRQANLTMRASKGGQTWLHLPWSACNGATTWQIGLNPAVSSDVHVHSGGGNLKLNLAGAIVTRIAADTGGGNIELVLPDVRGSVSVELKSGAGNVTLRMPGGTPARIQAATGWGKIIMDPHYTKLDDKTFESPDYANAKNKADISLTSGAGNVSVVIV